MTVKQKRVFAYVLACCAIIGSSLLWRQTASGDRAVVTEFTSVESTPLVSFSASSSALQRAVAPATDQAAARKEAPPPSLHAAANERSASSSSRLSAPQEELAQWEIRESFALSIPSLAVRAPVYLPSIRFWAARAWDDLERQMQVGLLSGVVAYPHSVAPGAKGTLIIAGHSSPPSDRAKGSRYGEIFARLPEVAIRDRIVLRAGESEFIYEVIDTKVVLAGDTAILAQQKEQSLLTLITCYPVGSTKQRYVVTARKI